MTVERFENLSIKELDELSIDELEKMAVHLNEVGIMQTGSNIEKERLNDILDVRKEKLNHEFKWTESNKEKLLYLNDKLIECFEKLKVEATAVLQTINNRINAKDDFLNDFELDASIQPYFYDEKDGERVYKEGGIEEVLMDNWKEWYLHFSTYNADDIIDDINFSRELNWNIEAFHGHFEEHYISYAIYVLWDHTEWSFSDILRINHLWAELKIIYQHSMELKE